MAEDQAIQNQRNAINEGSKTVRNTYLSYLAVTVYIWIAIESITHTQLLIPDDRLQLPVLDIGLPVVDFFFIAPILLLLMHTYFMIHVTQFAQLLDHQRNQKNLSTTWKQELDPSIFTGFFLQEEEQGFSEWLRDIFVLVSFWCVVPLVICRIQLKFLPYHHSFITPMHQGLLMFAIIFAAYFFCRIKPMQRGVDLDTWLGEVGDILFQDSKRGFSKKIQNGLTYFLILFAFSLFIFLLPLFSFTILKIPNDQIDNEAYFDIDQKPFEWIARLTNPGLKNKEARKIKISDVVDRNLILREKKLARGLSDTLIVGFKDEPIKLLEHTKNLNLQKRDLKFADFFKSDLTQADLRNAKLQGASLRYAELQEADLKLAKLQGADLRFAKLQGADFNSAQLKEADFGSAQLQGADFRFAKLQEAVLSSAQLQGADLRFAKFQGANLEFAYIQGVDLIDDKFEKAELAKKEILDSRTLERFKKMIDAKFGKAELAKMETQDGNLPEALKISHDCKKGIEGCGPLLKIPPLSREEILKLRKNIYRNLICEHPVLVYIQLKNEDSRRNFILTNDEVKEAQKGCEEEIKAK